MNINVFLGRVNEVIINPLIVLMFVAALLVFFWGLVEFIYKAGSDDGRETGKRHLMYGIVGMFVMVGVYGIIRLILNTFGIPTPSYIAPFV
jgi:phosphotransferase system  glucose/maltose/N-acetylglucosamine-specific IIC component